MNKKVATRNRDKIHQLVRRNAQHDRKHKKLCVSLMGNAGAGKSTSPRYFKEYAKKKIIVLSPNVTFAINIGGQIMYSFCDKIGIK
jgi:tRNA A37 threonylcarbamoyladenosine biosynthesis protein TsaE